MILDRMTVRSKFEIWSPRWSTREVLLADFKISTHNVLTFPKSRSLGGEWYISGLDAKTYPTEPMKTKSGTVMTMRVIPLDKLEPLEPDDINVASIAKSIKFGGE